jgi:DNA-binding response OmpR family regulator
MEAGVYLNHSEFERPSAQGSAPGPRILVVDDDADIRRLTAKLLANHGYQVDAAEDGAAGWEAICRTRYDLLITDHNMPRISGVELVQMLRSARMTLPVVLASGSLPAEVLDGNSPLRLAATLLKPFTCDELLKTVEQVLRTTILAREPLQPQPAWQAQAAPGNSWL